MDPSVHTPQCYALFDPIAPECTNCGMQADCIKEQERRLKAHALDDDQHSTLKASTSILSPKRKEKEHKTTSIQNGEEQCIPEHTRKPLEIPLVGTRIQARYKGQVYEAEIVDDPDNQRSGGRSILFNGNIYKTLTAAAHAIAPGINSGSVWQVV